MTIPTERVLMQQSEFDHFQGESLDMTKKSMTVPL